MIKTERRQRAVPGLALKKDKGKRIRDKGETRWSCSMIALTKITATPF
jgi:hypothetical protein